LGRNKNPLKNKSANKLIYYYFFKVTSMKKILTAAAILATLTTGIANAENFDFSYTFTNSDSLTPSYASVDTITGSFMGTLDPSTTLISNISDIQVSFDGVAFMGPLIATGWNTTTSAYDDTIAAVVSTNAALNNFAFADTDVAVNTGWNNGFVFINDPNYGQNLLAFNNYVQDSNSNTLSVLDTTANATWTVTAVPVPAALPMMLSGLGVLAAAARRRLQA
jgi:hypothetical protein